MSSRKSRKRNVPNSRGWPKSYGTIANPEVDIQKRSPLTEINGTKILFHPARFSLYWINDLGFRELTHGITGHLK